MSIANQNKRTGRAFQAKLAEMSGGMNIGTLGGEDVMHEEFSYEAKTYRPNTKSNKGKPWKGDYILTLYDEGKPTLDVNHFYYYEISTYENIFIMLRWWYWDALMKGEIPENRIKQYFKKVETRFIGNTYMKQAENNCPDGKVPIVVVHTVGRRHYSDVVLILREYWRSLLEKLFDKRF